MKLQFIEKNSDHESESDYETAIEMSHWNMDKFEYVFKTEIGLIVTFFGSHESITYSSHDENHDTDGSMYSSSRTKDDKSKNFINYELVAFSQNETKSVSIDKLTEMLASREGINEYDEYYQNKYSSIHQNLIDISLGLNSKELEVLKKYVELQKFHPHSLYDLPLPEKTLEKIKSLEKENNIIVEKNVITNAENIKNIEIATKIINDYNLKDKKVINKELFDLIINKQDSEELAQQVVTLIKDGANLNLENDIGDNAFMVACRKNMKIVSTAIFHETLKYNEDFIINHIKFDINKANHEGDTALIFTARKGHKQLFNEILNNSNSINLYHTNKFGKDALKTAKDVNNSQVLEFISRYEYQQEEKLERIHKFKR